MLYKIKLLISTKLDCLPALLGDYTDNCEDLIASSAILYITDGWVKLF